MAKTAASALEEWALKGFISGFKADRSTTEDVLQGVAEKLLRNPREMQQPRDYLVRASRNAAIDQYRGEERRRRRESDYALATRSEPRCAEATASDRQALEFIQQALNELPILTRRLFIQFHVLGFAQKEIAKAHGLHLSTVEKRIAKAKRHCLLRLDELMGPELD
ncbi:MAG: sigma-70 family RNA polymerase sigma factor [Pseudomonadota bacterium]